MLNKVILIGRLTHSPELKHTPTNTAVCSFSLAVNRDYVPANGGQSVDFINIIAWEKQAEFVTKYFTKGQPIVVTGRLQSRSYTDKNNVNKTVIEVNAEELHFAEPKKTDKEN